MFSYIKGLVTEVSGKHITLECNSIGYYILVPNPYLFKLQDFITVYLYVHVRENEQTLYGFLDTESRDLFLRLLTVAGIGPKSSLCILANASLQMIKEAIDNGDAKFFLKIPGIGSKTSQQIILDLKGKLNFLKPSINSKEADIKEALLVLGYKEKDYNSIMNLLDFSKGEDLILKDALKLLNSK